MYICFLKFKHMKHIKNFLQENNTYGVDINFIIDENNNFVSGKSTFGEETQDELKMICEKLMELDYIPKYNKVTHVSFVDGGDDEDGIPIMDLYFYHDGVMDDDNRPVITVTEQFLKEILN